MDYHGIVRSYLETVGELIDSEYEGTLGIKEKQFANTAGFYKKVWWRGSDWIPNFATETGIVFPTEKDTSGLTSRARASSRGISTTLRAT